MTCGGVWLLIRVNARTALRDHREAKESTVPHESRGFEGERQYAVFGRRLHYVQCSCSELGRHEHEFGSNTSHGPHSWYAHDESLELLESELLELELLESELLESELLESELLELELLESELLELSQ